MYDVFLSYASEDAARAEWFVRLFKSQNWSAFWDKTTIPAGIRYAHFIRGALADSRCVVVLWSEASVQSRWVEIEANEGLQRGVLVPVLLDRVDAGKLPFGLHDLQAVALYDWDGKGKHPNLRLLLQPIAEKIRQAEARPKAEAAAPPPEPLREPPVFRPTGAAPKRRFSARSAVLGIAAAVILAAGVFSVARFGPILLPGKTAPKGRAVFDQVRLSDTLLRQPMTRLKAREVLDSVPPDALARLRQYMYAADLYDASGSEQNPDALIVRLQTEFAEPIVLSKQVFDEMMQKVRSIDTTFPKPDKPDEYYGWNKVKAMLDPVYARVPPMNDAFAEIFKAPKPLKAAFLIDQYFASHYHDYRMHGRIVEFLGNGDFGKAPLPIFEKLLAETGPSEPNTAMEVDYGSAVNAGRAILGDGFDAWYRSVRGIGYEEEMRAWTAKQAVKKE